MYPGQTYLYLGSISMQRGRHLYLNIPPTCPCALSPPPPKATNVPLHRLSLKAKQYDALEVPGLHRVYIQFAYSLHRGVLRAWARAPAGPIPPAPQRRLSLKTEKR